MNEPRFKFKRLSKLQDDDDWRIAVHESGHAVFAAMHGRAFEPVRIGPYEFGEVNLIGNPFDYDVSSPQPSEDVLLFWKGFYAAGAAGEHLVFDEIRLHAVAGPNGQGSEGSDMERHRRLNERFGATEPFEAAIARAVNVLSECPIENVARELATRVELSADDVYRLIGRIAPWNC